MRQIDLFSEFRIGRKYMIDSSGPFTYSHRINSTHLSFKDVNEQTIDFESDHISKLLESNVIFEVSDPTYEASVPDFIHLDQFTRNVFGQVVIDLWLQHSVQNRMTRTELLELDDLCQEKNLLSIPNPGSNTYMELINDVRWSALKKYIHIISPVTSLPDQFA